MEDIKQKISEFVDNQLSVDEALLLLNTLNQHTELLETLNRYQALTESIRDDSFYALKADFFQNVHQSIATEPHYLRPQAKAKTTAKYNFPVFLAMAASIVVTVILVSRPSSKSEPNFTNQMLASQNSMRLVSTAARPKVARASTQTDEQSIEEIRFNDYLQAHNASLYTNGDTPQFRPYLQTVSYERK